MYRTHSILFFLTWQFGKKNDIRPFENATQLEFFCKKTDASLFAFGNHSKKRPDNLVNLSIYSLILNWKEYSVCTLRYLWFYGI